MRLCFVFVLTVVYAAITLVQCQNQEGFISLDCGLVPQDSTYTETTTNITYTSDWKYIDTGESKRVDPKYKETFQQQMWFVRSFPEGVRNCYNLNLTKGSKYLIRASFLYGNYDGLSQSPSFDVYIGPNLWGSVEITSEGTSLNLEIIHVLTSNNLQICLAKTGLSTPFISALVLRPLGNYTYKTQSGSLQLDVRRYFSTSTDFIRFEEDIHDRSWLPLFYPQDWILLSTNLTIGYKNNSYEVPQAVLRTAVIPKNASEAISLTWEDKDPNSRYYVFLHFAEIELLKANETREFNISANGGAPYGPFSPPNFTLFTLSTQSALSSQNGSYDVTLKRTGRSTRPPLINGLEIYKLIELTQLETDPNDVDAIKNIEATYGLNRINWKGDPCNPQKYVWDGMNCSYKELSPPRINYLNLSSSKLKGGIAPSIVKLTELTSLDLSNNNLTGEVPEFLAEMQHLTFINLSGNQLNGSVPKSLLDKQSDRSLTLIDDGNPSLCGLDSCNSKPSKKKNIIVPLVAGIAALVAVLAALVLIFVVKKKKQSTNETAKSRAASISQADTRSNRSSEPAFLTKERVFTYSEVLKMTNNFERVIGKGGFGNVYHGVLNGTDQVAVKMLSESSAQGFKQFRAEVELLLRVHHKDLVSLVGYCDDGDHLALIYEYMPNGDLKEHMSGQQGHSVLSWASRLKIASEAAQGLEYLHNGCKPPIVHRDVKTTNILLNERFQAKLADFGLSRSFLVEGETHVSTVVAGTPGYLDPDYYMTNRLTEKSDVFSFGVVLLEIITNQRVIDNSRVKPHIAEWIRLMVNGGDIGSIVDPKLHGDYDTNTVWKSIELALNCVNVTSSKRPTMTHVVMELNECLAAETARTQRSHELSSPEVSLAYISEYGPGAR